MLRKRANAQAQELPPFAAKFTVGSSDAEAGLSRRRFLRASGLTAIGGLGHTMTLRISGELVFSQLVQRVVPIVRATP